MWTGLTGELKAIRFRKDYFESIGVENVDVKPTTRRKKLGKEFFNEFVGYSVGVHGPSQKKIMTEATSVVKFVSYVFRVFLLPTFKDSTGIPPY